MIGYLTDAAAAKYLAPAASGELYVLLDPAMIVKASQKAPNGLDWAGLVSDFDAMGGSVPVPGPSPAPPSPGPTPTPPPPSPPAPAPAELFEFDLARGESAGWPLLIPRLPVALPAGRYAVSPVAAVHGQAAAPARTR